jgi:hypothetical protein
VHLLMKINLKMEKTNFQDLKSCKVHLYGVLIGMMEVAFMPSSIPRGGPIWRYCPFPLHCSIEMIDVDYLLLKPKPGKQNPTSCRDPSQIYERYKSGQIRDRDPVTNQARGHV